MTKGPGKCCERALSRLANAYATAAKVHGVASLTHALHTPERLDTAHVIVAISVDYGDEWNWAGAWRCLWALCGGVRERAAEALAFCNQLVRSALDPLPKMHIGTRVVC